MWISSLREARRRPGAARRILLAAVVAGLAVGGPGAAHAGGAPAAERVFPLPVHQQTLKNGLTVIVVPMPGSGLASVRTVVRTGSRDEYEPGHSGFAHFFEHMMFRGTKRMSQRERDRIIIGIGASTNAYTTNDRTVYQFDIAAADLETVMDLEADRFMNLHYTKEQFQTEAGAVYGEYRKNRASPGFQLHEALRATAFTRHTYGHTTMGFEKDIARMPRMLDYSRKFFSRYYRPDNTVLIVTGDVDVAATMALVDRYWARWKKGYVPPKVAREPEQKAERRVEVAYEGKTLPIVTFAYKGGAFAPDDLGWVSSLVLAEVAFGPTSPIYKRLVLEERLAQSLFVQPSESRDPGLFTIGAVVADPGQVDAVRAALEEAIAAARREPVPAQRIADTVSHLRYRFLLHLDTPDRVAEQLAEVAALTGGVAALDQLYTTLAQVTPETVRAAAERLLDARRRTVAILREKTP
jgi:zinc protease